MGEQLDALAGRSVPRSIRLRVDESELEGALDLLGRYAEAGCIEAAVDFKPGAAATVWRCGEAFANLVATRGRP